MPTDAVIVPPGGTFAHFHRLLWNEPNLVLVVGDATPLWRSLVDYRRRHGIARLEPRQSRALNRFMAACGLAAVSISERESWGWTATFPDTSYGLFCGVEPEGMTIGAVRQAQKSARTVVVQRQKGQEPLTQSHFTPVSADPAAAAARYYEAVLQIPARAAVLDDGRCVLAQALPEGRIEETASLSDARFVELASQMMARGELKRLDEVLLFAECRCTDEMILDMLTGLPIAQQAELWAGRQTLQIECPRCGREYTVRQKG